MCWIGTPAPLRTLRPNGALLLLCYTINEAKMAQSIWWMFGGGDVVCETPPGHWRCIGCINMCPFHDRLLQRGGFSAGRSCGLPFEQHHFPPLLGARLPDRLFETTDREIRNFWTETLLPSALLGAAWVPRLCSAGDSRGDGTRSVRRTSQRT